MSIFYVIKNMNDWMIYFVLMKKKYEWSDDVFCFDEKKYNWKWKVSVSYIICIYIDVGLFL